MGSDNQRLERIDRSLDRIDQHIERGNELMERNNGLIERNIQEFELNREVQVELLARTGEQHREVMRRLEDLGKRLEDLGVHMREQTQALMRIQERLGPGGQPA